MEEPSVLDYVKAKLTFWKPSDIEIPAPPEEQQAPQYSGALVGGGSGARSIEAGQDGAANGTAYGEAGVAVLDQPIVERQVTAVPHSAPRLSGQALLLTLASLALALLAQGLLEPPNRFASGAAVLYGVSAVLLGMAYFRDMVLLAPVPNDVPAGPLRKVRLEGLSLGLGLLVFAFLAFSLDFARGENDVVPYFTFLNTAFWVLSIGYLAWGFYVPHAAGGIPLRQRVSRFLAAPLWKVNISRFTLLLLVVAAVSLFFRFYRLEGVPSDMVSDHAEKLWDVQDVLNGQLRVFFPRNTGREAFQFYWTALMAEVFGTGISFMSLKLGTVLGGLLALLYTYRLGKVIGNRWVALYALLFCGVSFWANVQARFGLRFTLYPMFLAPMLFYLIRGLKEKRRNDFIWAGVWLGAGLHGYTSFRIVPFVVVAAIIIYLLHQRGEEERKFAIAGLVIVGLLSLAVLLPLARFATEEWDMVMMRSLTRLSETERALPGSPVEIFFGNTWNALTMFFWDNGDVWVHSIPHRPALDLISAALFFLGVVLVALRYARRRNWVDLFLLLSIPLLLLPSIMSLAFPNENPNLNRTAGAYIPVFLILAIGLDALLNTVRRCFPERAGVTMATALGLGLMFFAASANYDLMFNQYDKAFRLSAWNTAEMGAVVEDFAELTGAQPNDSWVVAYPYWVDTRLVAMNAGYPDRDMAISAEQLGETVENPRSKLFLLNPQDTQGLQLLANLYPEGRYWMYSSQTPGKDFYVFLVPPIHSVSESLE